MCDDSFITALFQLDEFPADCEPFFESEDDEESSTDGKSQVLFIFYGGGGSCSFLLFFMGVANSPPKTPYFC